MKAGKVKRSFARFNEYASDVLSADSNTLKDRLNFFMTFCEEDEVMSLIHAQLISNNNVDFDAWLEGRIATIGSFMGSGELEFPTNLDDRMSLMYQLLCRIHRGDIDLVQFSLQFFSTGSKYISDKIYAFNEAVSRPLFREMSYRFEDLIDDLPESNAQEVSPSVIQFIGHAQSVIQQNVSGSNNVVSANINNQELDSRFEDLEREIRETFDPSEAKDYLEAVSGAKQLLEAPAPNKSAATRLLETIPHVGNIAQLVAAVVTCIANIGG